MSMSPKTDLGGNTLGKHGKHVAAASAATFVDSAIIDTTACGDPSSMLAICTAAFTPASGDTTTTHTIDVVIQHGDDSGLSDAATLVSYSKVYTWATGGDAATHTSHFVPAKLDGAKRYVRVRGKITRANTGTTTAYSVGLTAVMGGLDTVPHSGYVATGYSEATIPA